MASPPEISKLFVAVRRASSAANWSRGVELARAGAASLSQREDDELQLRVTDPKRVVAPTVTLYLEDEEWDCDCEGDDPCAHVAGAVIALKRAAENGEDLKARSRPMGRVVYRLTRMKGRPQLTLERRLRFDSGERPLQSTLAAALKSRATGAQAIHVTAGDLALDRVLSGRPHGSMPGDTLAAMLQHLMDAEVTFEGQPVQASGQALLPRASVRDTSQGFVLRLEQPTDLEELVTAHVGRAGGTLRPLGETALAGTRWQNLPSEREFRGAQVTELVTKVLPSLRQRIPVEIKTKRLPEVSKKLEPRAQLEVRQLDGVLDVMATVVYGRPAAARVDGDTLVPLRGGAIPLRNEAKERRVVERLREQLDLLPGHRRRATGGEAARLAEKLDSWQGEISGDAPARFVREAELTPSFGPSPSSGTSGSPLGFGFGASADGEELHARAEDVLRAWNDGVSLVPLLEGGFAQIPQSWLAEHGHRVALLLAARKEDGDIEPHALPTLARLCEDLEQPAPPGYEHLRPLLDGFRELPQAQLPEDLKATLRPYQQAGVNWLSFLRRARLGATLADDMGLGKTLQSICVLSGKSLVVCPTSVIHNWAAELQRFRPQLRVSIYHGAKREMDADADVTLTSYALLRLDQELLCSTHWDNVVLDEAQTIKNPDSQVSRAAFELQADFRLTLSGTPVENRLEELWSQLHFTNPGLLGGRGDFDERYARPIAEGSSEAARALRDRIAPFVLRRVKRDVAPELPPRTDKVLYCELGDDERALYQAVHAATQEDVVKQLQAGGGVMQALEALLRLRQAACHPSLLPDQDAADSAKTRQLRRALETAAAEGHRSLVFSQWTSFLDLVEPELEECGLDFVRLDGTTRDRQAVVERFQAESGPPVMLLSLKAGGTGLNLTGADHVFLLDLWWNPAVEEQAADRAHRIGQTNPVVVHRLVAKDTVEERILALQAEKRSLADAALGNADRATSLSRDDLLMLLS